MSEHVSPHSPAEAPRPSRVGRIVLAAVFASATALALGVVYLTEDRTLAPLQRQARGDIRRLQTFLQAHHRILGRFPSEQEGFAPLIEAKLIPAVPRDPWGRPYLYQYDGKKGRVLSYGADGQPGGTGDNADLGSGGVLTEDSP